jgi:Nucleotidyl transferase AbiEii toxin, Type IV TA system
MAARQYATPLAFKQALEQRLKSASTTGADFARRRQLLVFDRFLARLTQIAGDAVTLKGGLVLELRLARARTTKDVDLRIMGSSADVLECLQKAGRLDLGDHMRFEVQPDHENLKIRNEGMRYEGLRHRAECRLAGMIYGRPFGVDVAFGDPLVGEPDIVTADDTLGFADIAPPSLRLYPVVSHIAEKLHAFTMPRSRPNSRVRDLPDLALLATTGPIEGRALRRAIERTFEFRATHPVPSTIPSPPAFWEAPYAAMAASDELAWATLAEVSEAVSLFLAPALQSADAGIWEPSAWRWR